MTTAQVAQKPIEQLCVDTIRTLSMDAVQAARSGHPGAPMAMAPAPLKELQTKFGFTTQGIASAAKELLRVQ